MSVCPANHLNAWVLLPHASTSSPGQFILEFLLWLLETSPIVRNLVIIIYNIYINLFNLSIYIQSNFRILLVIKIPTWIPCLCILVFCVWCPVKIYSSSSLKLLNLPPWVCLCHACLADLSAHSLGLFLYSRVGLLFMDLGSADSQLPLCSQLLSPFQSQCVPHHWWLLLFPMVSVY